MTSCPFWPSAYTNAHRHTHWGGGGPWRCYWDVHSFQVAQRTRHPWFVKNDLNCGLLRPQDTFATFNPSQKGPRESRQCFCVLLMIWLRFAWRRSHSLLLYFPKIYSHDMIKENVKHETACPSWFKPSIYCPPWFWKWLTPCLPRLLSLIGYSLSGEVSPSKAGENKVWTQLIFLPSAIRFCNILSSFWLVVYIIGLLPSRMPPVGKCWQLARKHWMQMHLICPYQSIKLYEPVSKGGLLLAEWYYTAVVSHPTISRIDKLMLW